VLTYAQSVTSSSSLLLFGFRVYFFSFKSSVNGISRVTCLLTYIGNFLMTCTWAFREPGAKPKPSAHQSLSTVTILCPSYILSESIAYEGSLCNCSCILRLAFFVEYTSIHTVYNGGMHTQWHVSNQLGAHDTGAEVCSQSEQLVSSTGITKAHRSTFERLSHALFTRVCHYPKPKLTVKIELSEDLNDP